MYINIYKLIKLHKNKLLLEQPLLRSTRVLSKVFYSIKGKLLSTVTKIIKIRYYIIIE